MSNETKWTPSPWWIDPETGDVVAKNGDWEGNACVWQEAVEQHLDEYRQQADENKS